MKTLIDEDYKGNILGILNCLILLRKLTNVQDKNSGVEFLRSGILLYLEKYTDASLSDFPEIQQEACWIVSNVCSLENVDVLSLSNSKIIRNLVLLLKSQNKEVLLNAIWALCNYSGDTIDCRNKLLEFEGIFDCIYGLILRLKNTDDPMYNPQILAEAIWLISNLLRKPYPPYKEVTHFLLLR